MFGRQPIWVGPPQWKRKQKSKIWNTSNLFLFTVLIWVFVVISTMFRNEFKSIRIIVQYLFLLNKIYIFIFAEFSFKLWIKNLISNYKTWQKKLELLEKNFFRTYLFLKMPQNLYIGPLVNKSGKWLKWI